MDLVFNGVYFAEAHDVLDKEGDGTQGEPATEVGAVAVFSAALSASS